MSTTSCMSVGTRGQPGTALLQEGTMESSSPLRIRTMINGRLVTVPRIGMQMDGGSTVASHAT